MTYIIKDLFSASDDFNDDFNLLIEQPQRTLKGVKLLFLTADSLSILLYAFSPLDVAEFYTITAEEGKLNEQTEICNKE